MRYSEIVNNSSRLTPWTFDQNNNLGWRSEKNPNQRIYSIIDYLKSYSKSSEEWKNTVPKNESEPIIKPYLLMFHLGQCYAFSNNYKMAIKYFKMANKTSSNDWNSYVDASIAFLNNDLENFKKYAKLANQNKKTIKNLLKNFGKPYSKAY